MGKPLVIGGKAERYSRVAHKDIFDKNFDKIDWGHAPRNPHSGRRLRIRFVAGVKVEEDLDTPKTGTFLDIPRLPAVGPLIIVK